MLSEIVSFAFLLVFTILLVIAVLTTGSRWLRYHRTGFRRPRLLNRDVVLVIGLAVPFVLILLNRAFDWQAYVINKQTGHPELWWLLLTGLPAIVALAVYDWFELAVIERDQEDAPPPQ